MPGPSEFQLVTDAAGLRALAALLARQPEHALDSEANSGFAYRERLCLLQMNVAGRLFLVDLVALPGGAEALDPLRPALESPDHRTLLHGGEFDVACLKRDYGLALEGIWDTQQAASLLGWPQTGYGALVEKVCDVALRKGHAFHDWARRPIAAEPLQYALDDVRYLPQVASGLRAAVGESDLEEEVEIASQAVAEATWNGGFRPDGFWRIKGIRDLPKQRLPLLVALYAWRERAAEDVDQPPGRLINNAHLLALARAAPQDLGALRRTGFRGRRLDPLGDRVLEVIREARRRPPAVPRPTSKGRSQSPAERKRGDLLRTWRRAEAKRRGVIEQAVLPAAALRHLQAHGGDDLEAVPQLGAKRRALYGARLAELGR